MSVTELRSSKGRVGRRVGRVALWIVAALLSVAVLVAIAAWIAGADQAVAWLRDAMKQVRPLLYVLRLSGLFLVWYFWEGLVSWYCRRKGIGDQGRRAALAIRNRFVGTLLALEVAFLIPRVFGGGA